MFGLIGKENKWFFGLSRKEFLPKETEQQRRNRLEEVLSIHKAFTDAAERHNVELSGPTAALSPEGPAQTQGSASD